MLQEAGTNQRRAELGRSFREQQGSIRAALAAQPGDTALEEAMITHRLREGPRGDDFEIPLRAMLNDLRLGLGQTGPPAEA